MAMSRIQRYKKSLYFTTQTSLCTKITRVHLLNPLLYETDAKVRKKSVFHNTDLLKNRLTMKSKKILPRVTYNAKLSKLYETPIPM